jgi:hypothetical protein
VLCEALGGLFYKIIEIFRPERSRRTFSQLRFDYDEKKHLRSARSDFLPCQHEYFLDGFAIQLHKIADGSGIAAGTLVSHFINAIRLDSQIG